MSSWEHIIKPLLLLGLFIFLFYLLLYLSKKLALKIFKNKRIDKKIKLEEDAEYLNTLSLSKQRTYLLKQAQDNLLIKKRKDDGWESFFDMIGGLLKFVPKVIPAIVIIWVGITIFKKMGENIVIGESLNTTAVNTLTSGFFPLIAVMTAGAIIIAITTTIFRYRF